MDKIINIVNEALKIYHNTPVESYPEARAIDKIDELTSFNSTERVQAYNIFYSAIDIMKGDN